MSGLHRVGWGVRPQVSRASGSWSSAFGYRVNVGKKRKINGSRLLCGSFAFSVKMFVFNDALGMLFHPVLNYLEVLC